MEQEKTNNKMLAAIRIRGEIGIDIKIKTTLALLKLLKKHTCVVFKDSESIRGMLNKVKDYVTWGEIDTETYNLMIEKRGQEYKGPEKDSKDKIDYSRKYIIINDKKIKPFFRLSPPKGGFERKGIKNSYQAKGALGYRKNKINDLIKKMI